MIIGLRGLVAPVRGDASPGERGFVPMAESAEKAKGLLAKILKNTLLVVVIVLLIGIAIGAAIMYKPTPEEEVPVTALATVGKPIVRVGEPVNFSSEGCTGDIKSYRWELGDGNATIEPNPTYTYHHPGWYNVTLYVTDKDDMYTNHTIFVGVQHEDVEAAHDLGMGWDLRPRYISWRWEDCLIGPNIAHPTTDVSVDLAGAFGTFEIEVYIFVSMGGGWWHGYGVDSQLILATGSIDYLYTIEPEEFPEDECDSEIAVEVRISVREGVYTGGEISFDAVFPMEGISPPWQAYA